MARVTANEVKSIMDNCTISDTIVGTFILASNELVTKIFGVQDADEDTIIKEIERWFTAHMIASTLHRTTSIEKLGDAAVTFTGKWGEGLSSTPYGQMVLTLDTAGLMKKLGKESATMTAVVSFDADDKIF
jgi:hypothetical protein